MTSLTYSIIHSAMDTEWKPYSREPSRSKSKHGKAIRECKKCHKRFKFKGELNTHMDTHRQYFECNLCDRNFESRTILHSHKIEVHFVVNKRGKIDVECGLCGVVMDNTESFREHHKNLHSGLEPQWACTKCELVFTGIHNFRYHQKTHDQPENCWCDICKRQFCSASYLKTHQQFLHSKNEFPYKCTKCDQCFTSSTLCDEHLKIHLPKPKKFECHICEKGFDEFVNLNIHYGLHHPEPEDNKHKHDKRDNIKPPKHKRHYAEQKYPKTIKKRDKKNEERVLDIHDSIALVRYECRQCTAAFESVHELENHAKSHIIILDDDDDDDKINNVELDDFENEFKSCDEFECFDCNMVFESSEDFERHSNLHIQVEM